MRWLTAPLAALVLASALPAAATAQAPAKRIAFKAGKLFRHKHTRLVLPATLDGLPMVRITEFEGDQIDVSVNYAVPGQGDEISVYLYRFVTGSLPIWFDRARYAIENRSQLYGTPRAAVGVPTAFAPPGQANSSALLAAYDVDGGYRSTAVALVPFGEWLVKIRYSTSRHDAVALAGRVRSLLGELTWPAKLAAAPDAVPVSPCAGQLVLTGQAMSVANDSTDGIRGSFVAAVPASRDAGVATKTWCRDEGDPQLGVYRVEGATDAYLIALSDAGRGIRAEPVRGSVLPADGTAGASPPRWRIDLIEMGRTMTYGLQDRLPPPRQSLEIALQTTPASISTTWGRKREVVIDRDAGQ